MFGGIQYRICIYIYTHIYFRQLYLFSKFIRQFAIFRRSRRQPKKESGKALRYFAIFLGSRHHSRDWMFRISMAPGLGTWWWQPFRSGPNYLERLWRYRESWTLNSRFILDSFLEPGHWLISWDFADGFGVMPLEVATKYKHDVRLIPVHFVNLWASKFHRHLFSSSWSPQMVMVRATPKLLYTKSGNTPNH